MSEADSTKIVAFEPVTVHSGRAVNNNEQLDITPNHANSSAVIIAETVRTGDEVVQKVGHRKQRAGRV